MIAPALMTPLASAGIGISDHAVNQAPFLIGLKNQTADVFSDNAPITSAII
jgi:hypothetical protein